MTFYRVLAAIGRTLITAGVILLLFVAYQLWGTGLHTRAAQSDLEDEFTEGMTALASAEEGAAEEDAPPSTLPELEGGWGDGEGLGATFGLTARQIEEARPPEPSESAGRINIPAIGSEWWYVEGVDLAWLRDGPGHFPGTKWPGQEGNAGLAGHRTTYGAPFHRIDELEPGDEILVETIQGEFRYEVMSRRELAEEMPFEATGSEADDGHFIIEPADAWILDDYDDDRLTLMACHPKYSASQRIVVVGRLVDEAAPTTPPSEPVSEEPSQGQAPTEIEDLGGGDTSARLPALLWALAAGAVWLTAWMIGRRWPRGADGPRTFSEHPSSRCSCSSASRTSSVCSPPPTEADPRPPTDPQRRGCHGRDHTETSELPGRARPGSGVGRRGGAPVDAGLRRW